MSVDALRRTQRLVALAQEGDASALEQLCGVYAERVRRIVRFRMGPELRSQLESMDLVQEALIDAVKDLGAFTYSSEGDFLGLDEVLKDQKSELDAQGSLSIVGHVDSHFPRKYPIGLIEDLDPVTV